MNSMTRVRRESVEGRVMECRGIMPLHTNGLKVVNNLNRVPATSAADCIKVAERAAQMTRLIEYPSRLPVHLLVLQQFNLQRGLPSVKTVDEERKQPVPEASDPTNHSDRL